MAKKKSQVETAVKKPSVTTHSFCLGLDGDDGITRRVQVSLLDDGNYRVTIATHWPKKDDVSITDILFSPPSMRLLTETLIEAQHNMHRHPVAEPGND